MIVEAKPEHAHEVCDAMRESIEKLCVVDHKNDPKILESWLSNKTPENCKLWIESKEGKSFVAIAQEGPAGIATIGKNGHIYLCYMHPDKAGEGFGKQLISACGDQALAWGLKQMTVDSTQTAKAFYESQGFEQSGEPSAEDDMYSYPLSKQLKP